MLLIISNLQTNMRDVPRETYEIAYYYTLFVYAKRLYKGRLCYSMLEIAGRLLPTTSTSKESFVFMSTNETTTKDPFAFLAPHEFIVLTTYRKTGDAMPTTVWFAYDQGKIYITTGKSAGKAKRVRNNGRVQMTPSDRVGNLLGEPVVQGQAREVTPDERVHARATLAQKYGEMFEKIAGQESPDRTYLIVESLS
jgi:PPOX class probable F420-dependent enzyme